MIPLLAWTEYTVSGLSHSGHSTNFLINPSSNSCSFSELCEPFTMYLSCFMSNCVWAPNSQPKYLVGSAIKTKLIVSRLRSCYTLYRISFTEGNKHLLLTVKCFIWGIQKQPHTLSNCLQSIWHSIANWYLLSKLSVNSTVPIWVVKNNFISPNTLFYILSSFPEFDWEAHSRVF